MKNLFMLKRSMALLLATAMTWTGTVTEAGLFEVEATEEQTQVTETSEKVETQTTEVAEIVEEAVPNNEVAREATLIASFDFDDATAGSEIVVSGAKASGNYSLVNNDISTKFKQSLSLDGRGQYLSITDANGGSLLAGLDEISISADINFQRTATNWLFYASDSANSQVYKNERYIGAFLKNGNELDAEQYNNTGSRIGCAYAPIGVKAWYHIEAVYSKNSTRIYIDGEKVAEYNSGMDVKDIVGNNGVFYIGRANWGNGEYCQAYVDNFKVYSGQLSDEQIASLYSNYTEMAKEDVVETDFTLNAGYVTKDIELPASYNGEAISWTSSNEAAVTSEGKVTRGDVNQEVTLTATIGAATKVFKVIVLKKGKNVVSYTTKNPAVGQGGGMLLAVETEKGYEPIHKGQPVLYTTLGNKYYTSPALLRSRDAKSFILVAADGKNDKLITYTTKDLITYENETLVQVKDINSIKKIEAFYSITEDKYILYAESGANVYKLTSDDMKSFSEPVPVNYEITTVAGAPEDANFPVELGLTNEEFNNLYEKFTNPVNTSLKELPSEAVEVAAGTTNEELEATLKKYLEGKKVTAGYSNNDKKEYSLRIKTESLEKVNTNKAGEYTVEGVIGGSGNYTDAEDSLIPERADPFVIKSEDDGYYYFTASYPMYSATDAEGYDRIVLRRAKTIEGLAEAEEVTIWDENEDADLGRFIWAPEMHKIGDSWYLVATAGLNSGNGTSFNIRPFMIKFNGDATKDSLLDKSLWGKPELVKAYGNDPVVGGMSLDMTYFEAGGKHYLVWADETINTKNPNGSSYLFIATIDPANPTQLTSEAQLLTKPEYSWELVRYKVNEGPGVYHKDGKVYMTFSASGTGSEYCVGLMYADESADLLDVKNWTKLPYPIMTSSDFDNEVSGPGHNSFTVDENGNLVIVYHARVTESHNSHTGDSLYDPCRNAYVKTVLFDRDGLPVFNMSDDQFIKGGDTFKITVRVVGDKTEIKPIAEYNFDENFTKGTAKDSAGRADATLAGGATYVTDKDYGQVLYLDGAKSVGGKNSYLELPKGLVDGKDELTVSFDVNEVTRVGNYFTFTLGKDTDKYLFYKAMPTSEKLAITKSGSGSERTVTSSGVYPNTSRTWINIKIVVKGDRISLYRDGQLLGTAKNTGVKISDFGADIVGYLGKSFYPADTYFRGYFDNVKIYDVALTAAQVEDMYRLEQAAVKETASSLETVAENFVISNMDEITGNINLPEEINGVKVMWTSSNESIISTSKVVNKNYDDTPAGVVTRPEKDTEVVLKAVFAKNGKTAEKTYKCKVKAKTTKAEDYAGYLFVHFTGTEQSGDDEQVYFSLSKDGLNWTDLNDNQPVLKSRFGESGLRDMYIARSAEGDKFYMIATDLSIYNNPAKGSTWGQAGSNGSHSIVVWESKDLVNWSEPWLAEIAPEGAGCTWAPEFIYDEKTGEYIVYWASTTLEVDSNKKITQEYENHTIYYAKTRDFVHFTDPEVYHAGEKNDKGVITKVIDSTMIEDNGVYYRYTKNESVGIIKIDCSDSVLGEYKDINSDFLSSKIKNKVGVVEGPIIFKLNEKTTDGKDQWCLYVDRYGTGSGYYPVITTDLSDGEAFRFLDDKEYNLPTKYRHGYVMPITAEEYATLSGNAWENVQIEETRLQKTTRLYTVGQTLNTDDIRIRVILEDGTEELVKDYTTNAGEIDMTTAGEKKLVVSYTVAGKKLSEEISITVADKAYGEVKTSAKEQVESELSKYLLASYSFDGNIEDSTGNTAASPIVRGLGSYTGKISYTAGVSGKAIDFNNYGLDLNLKNVGTDYTVSFLVYPDKTQAENQIMIALGYHNPELWTAISGTGTNETYKLWGNNGNGAITTGEAIGMRWTTIANPSIKNMEWSMVTLVGSDGMITAYVDGKKLCEKAYNNPLCGENQTILLGANNWDSCFDGKVDELKVYSIGLTEEQILAENKKFLEEKAGKLLEKPEYIDPFTVIKEADARVELKKGNDSDIFTVPESVKDYVVVEYSSNNTSVISLSDGKLSALKAGKAIVTATVTSKYDGYKVNYSTLVDVTEKSSGTTVKPIGNKVPSSSAAGALVPATKTENKTEEKPSSKKTASKAVTKTEEEPEEAVKEETTETPETEETVEETKEETSTSITEEETPTVGAEDDVTVEKGLSLSTILIILGAILLAGAALTLIIKRVRK